MKHYYSLLFLLLFPLLVLAQPAHGKKVVGYYAQWSIYARDFNIPKIDGSKLTHLNYSFYGTTFDPAQPQNTKLKCLDTYADFEHTEGGIPWDAPVKGNFYDLKKLKEKYPHLKILISVGGWTKGQDLSPIAASPVARAALATDMANFITTYPFIDGFDIDWEYPLSGGTDGTEVINGTPIPPQKYSPDDNKNLVYLLKAMRLAMPNKLVTIAAGNNVRKVGAQYLGPNNRSQYGMTEDISTYCDYITYFGYDLGGNWYDKTCYNAPLYASGNTNDPLYGATQSESLDELTNQFLNVVGFPANKLIMGLPFYGKKFDNVANNGTNPNLPGLFVSAPRYSVPGCTNPQNPTGTWDGPAACEKSGSIEICDLVGNPVTNPHPYLDPNTMLVTPTAAAAGWVRYFDNTTKVPYLYNATLKQFISYEDKQSMDLKVQYIKSKNLAGGMIWELSQDTRGAIPNALLNQVDTSFGSILPGSVSIAGTVKNGTALVPDVTVELRDASNTVLSTVIATTGNFSFNNLALGQNYSLTASKATYTFTPVTLTNVTTNQTAVVIQGTQPLYTVSGTVLDGTTPVSGVTVSATSGTTVLTAVSNASGVYTIGGLTAGLNFTVTAAKSGFSYMPASTVYTAIDTNKTLNFTQGAAVVNYTVSGTILNNTTPVSGVTVTAASTSGNFTAVTNASGMYSLSLPSGSNYTVTAALSGQTYTPASTVYSNLNANKTLNFSQDVVVIGGNKISGTVKNGTTPVPGAKVELVLPWTDNAHGWKSVFAITDAQGKYSFSNDILSGYNTVLSLKLNAWENGDVVYLPSNLTNFPIPATATIYDFNTNVVVTPTYFSVSGTVLNGTTPVSAATISAVSGATTLTAVSDAAGNYTVANLVSGSDYTVTITKTGLTFTPASTVYTAINSNKTLSFTQTVVNPVYYTVSGTVLNGTTPVSGVMVSATSGTTTLTAVSDAAGNYTVANLVSGSNYTVTAAKSGLTFTPASTVYNAISANKTLSFTQNVVTPVYYTVSGTAKNGTTAVAGVTVSATSGTTTLTAVSDASGNYILSNLIAGSDYIVTASKTGLSFSPSSIIYTAIASSKTLNFTQNVANGYLISGTVKNGTAPVAGIKVDLILPYTDDTHGWVNLSTLSDAQGNYHFENAAINGYKTFLSLKINAWENQDVTYLPSYPQTNLPTAPQVFNFNTQSVVATKPVVTITAPTTSAIAINLGSAVNFAASVGLTASDATTISSVVFSLDGQSLSATNSSGTYTAIWTPAANQFSLSHTLTVTATASNGTTDSKTYSFTLNCSGANCPNSLPVITWNTPSNTTVNQSSFQVVPISVTAVDSDGSVSGVTITINGGTFNMAAGANNTYTYNFTPSAYQDYPVVIKATDNKSGVTTLNNTIKIAPINNNRFIPLPSKIILGYAHSWENASAPFLYFSQMVGSKFNVVDYSFVETVNRDGYTPVLTTNDTRYLTNGVFNKQLLKNDIKSLRDSGVPVIVSIGGQNGHVVLDNVAQKNIFVNGLKAIIDEYQFDGVDIDFEGGSMNFSAGGLRDISYTGISAYPRLKNVVDAFKELKAHYGPGFLLTAAPETQYVQGGYSTYNDTFGSFLPIIQNLRNELDLLAVQLYNTGGENGLDGQYYGSAKRANMVTALTDMLVKGYNIGTTGMRFDGLPPSKILIGLPACPSAAGSGFITSAEGISALHYLRTGTTFSGRTYTMQPGGPYPDLRGLMTWSVNWDASSCGNSSELSKAYAAYFASQSGNKIFSAAKIEPQSTSTVTYFNNDVLTVKNDAEEIAQVSVFNSIGQILVSYDNVQSNKEIYLQNRNFSTKQLFIVIVTDKSGNKHSFKVMNFLN
ncbi:glycosyl hydrolase family 18 protein [Flavobacterium sp. Fl-77]|uniref:chitinase n=1 Tax=Flavobacterium flavipigmentatum TaxID=2893884 RepID=A0AAJ2SBL6_9FLAO|nr:MULTISPECIES: glycosyl hydrolase family 18 protein [unclassified Flavobacterium]MDX6182696.1 glycosyl hydrolase family 18 protein [Flavobacterium sp. Fl-33]MDX6186124.1 glycosyl hydrolase family 18 protein [Flavobacterium sp. Fl-77]UFH38272.1 T9SS sorting signal type C domain-containing protein [Flavobacterium sp. F-70]